MVFIVVTCENGSPIKAEIKLSEPKILENQTVFRVPLPKVDHKQISMFDNFEPELEIPGQLSMFE